LLISGIKVNIFPIVYLFEDFSCRDKSNQEKNENIVQNYRMGRIDPDPGSFSVMFNREQNDVIIQITGRYELSKL